MKDWAEIFALRMQACFKRIWLPWKMPTVPSFNNSGSKEKKDIHQTEQSSEISPTVSYLHINDKNFYKLKLTPDNAYMSLPWQPYRSS